MELRYFKREWEELRGDEHDDWGTSSWYFEVDPDGYVTRQIEVYQNEIILKYDESKQEDEYGGLSDQSLDIDDFSGYEMDKVEFELIWAKEGQ